MFTWFWVLRYILPAPVWKRNPVWRPGYFIQCFIYLDALAGILSLVLFDVHYQRREIGIRRVYGSSVSEILYRLNKVYLKVLLISFVIAIPVSYYFMERWASNFMEKAPVGYLIYFVALLWISILTVGVVTFQSWRAANENPVDML